MTVKELIEKLQKAKQDAEVVFNIRKHIYSIYVVSEEVLTDKEHKESINVCVLECTKEKIKDGIPCRYDHIL
jgi:hypothetical protein